MCESTIYPCSICIDALFLPEQEKGLICTTAILRNQNLPHLLFRIITEKYQNILYKNPNKLLQIRKKDVIILVYDSRNCERGGDASLSY